jgi:adenylate cyclase
VQDRIVGSIVGKLHVKLTHIEHQRAFARPTESLEAYQLALRARALLNRTTAWPIGRRACCSRGRRSWLRTYAEIRTLMGAAEFQRYTDGWVENAAESVRRAEELAKSAVASPDSRAHVRAHSLLAGIYGHQDRYSEALAHAQSAIDLNPSDATALWWRGSASLSVGRIEEGIAFLETARRFEPRPSAGMGMNLAIGYYVAGRHTDALLQAESILAVTPRYVYAHAMRAASLAKLGRSVEARAAAEQVRRVDPLFDPDNFGARFEDPRYTALLREGLRQAGL